MALVCLFKRLIHMIFFINIFFHITICFVVNDWNTLLYKKVVNYKYMRKKL